MISNTASVFASNAGQAQSPQLGERPAQPPQIQLCVQAMEEEAKKLRAIVEHLAGRLHDVLIAVPAQGQAGGETRGQINTCPLTDILAAQIGHIAVSRSVLEDLLSRIQL